LALPTAVGRKRRKVVRALLDWWGTNQRDFPWRRWTDLYRLLVTEVLLRQTRAEAVATFIPEFLDRYPHVDELSDASEGELATTLRPLGFSRQRAPQLLQLAKRLQAGPVPTTQTDFMGLPGIGKYAAGMVAAATGQRVPAVDTNVARVLCRVFGINPSHAEARKSSNVWAEAEAMVDCADQAVDVTWAILDLAALICVDRRPRCPDCPLQKWCVYAASTLPSSISRRGHRAQRVETTKTATSRI
jgi:A/G-specific adenine glycosylase